MIFDRKNLTDNQLLDLYKRILKPRLIEKNVDLIRQERYLNGSQELVKLFLLVLQF
jgi:hypothetical protein